MSQKLDGVVELSPEQLTAVVAGKGCLCQVKVCGKKGCKKTRLRLSRKTCQAIGGSTR